MKIKVLLVASICLSTNLFAGGYRVSLQGNNATGMGHAGVAMTESAETVYFNPANMSFLKSKYNSTIGLNLINTKGMYQDKASNTEAETDNPTGTPFHLYHAIKYNEKISFGFAMYTPYGNSVVWPTNWAGSHVLNEISLKTIYSQPSISFKVNDKLSVGFGPIYVNGYVNVNRNLTTTLVDNDFNRSNVTIRATGLTAWGYSIGILSKPIEALSVGINYRSRIDMKAENRTVEFNNVPDTLKAGFTDTTFNAELVLPAELTIGLAYDVSPQTTVAFDINRTFWSAYESLDIFFNNGNAPSLSPRNYDDANVYRIGAQHALNSNLTIRVGAYYDESPLSEGYYSPEAAREDSLGLTTGASYEISKHTTVSFSFIYLIIDEFNGSYDYIDTDSDPDVTTYASFGGDYLTNVTIFGLGFNYQY